MWTRVGSSPMAHTGHGPSVALVPLAPADELLGYLPRRGGGIRRRLERLAAMD